MNTKISFTKIGFFVLSLFALLLAFIFWLGQYGLKEKKHDFYTIYFSESISGLNVESPIKYKGLDVGKVASMQINPNNSNEIEILVDLNHGTPIKEDTVAVLKSLGITGLRYIELLGGSQNSPLLIDKESTEKIIPSKKSVTSSIDVAIEDFSEVIMKIKNIFNDENLTNISHLLKNSSQSSQNIEELTHYLNQQQKNFTKLIATFANFANSGSKSFKTIDKSAKSVSTSAKKFEELSAKLIDEIDKGSFNLKDISQDSINELNSVLRNLNQMLIQTQTLIEEIENSPSDIIFKQQQIEYGPGE